MKQVDEKTVFEMTALRRLIVVSKMDMIKNEIVKGQNSIKEHKCSGSARKITQMVGSCAWNGSRDNSQKGVGCL